MALAAQSEFLQYRNAVYVASGFAGIAAMALLLVQPLLAAGVLPGVPARRGRRLHRWTGAALLLAVALHVAGLWLTSPPDMVDALTFTAPTAFSVFGVVAMWALVAAAAVAGLRRRMALRPRTWRLAHTALAVVVVGGSVIHALLIEGTMEPWSKVALCLAVSGAMVVTVVKLRAWSGLGRPRRNAS
ncbi:ferric reductase [Rhodobacterales bacterium HKCCE2091]|nr:ferric reductase [Rhodobacterales bacterium HKCCE2091]